MSDCPLHWDAEEHGSFAYRLNRKDPDSPPLLEVWVQTDSGPPSVTAFIEPSTLAFIVNDLWPELLEKVGDPR